MDQHGDTVMAKEPENQTVPLQVTDKSNIMHCKK